METLILTDEQQARVTLAKDVIAQLGTRRFIALGGSYLTTYGNDAVALRESAAADDARAVLGKLRTCEVCAVGSLFLATIERHNGVTMDGLSLYGDGGDDFRGILLDNDERRKPLLRFFTADQLALVESAFERCEFTSKGVSGDDVEGAIAFGCDYEDDDDRLRAIMNNIIANGEFVP